MGVGVCDSLTSGVGRLGLHAENMDVVKCSRGGSKSILKVSFVDYPYCLF